MTEIFTLADFEKSAPDNLQKVVVRTWREASPFMDMLRFRTSDNLSEKVLRYTSLPGTSWRSIGESFTNVKVDPDQVEERLFFLGNNIDVPYEYVKAKSLVDPRQAMLDAYLKAVAFDFNTYLFRNTPTADPKGIVGLWYRINNDLGASARFDAALDVSPDTGTATWKADMIDAVDKLLDMVDGNPSDKVLVMGKTLYRRFQSCLRQSQLLDTTQDQLGRQFLTYGKGGAKIMEAGYQRDQATQILTDVETSYTSLTSGTKSSMYCIRFGAPYLEGWCQEKPNAEDVGLLESRTAYRTVVRFSPGLFLSHPRAMALAYGWQAA